MTTSPKLEKKLNKVPRMGLCELDDFKAEVVNSLLDNPTKFYAYDIIDKRIDVLKDSAVIENEHVFISGFEVE